jgi:hypothetical protein
VLQARRVCKTERLEEYGILAGRELEKCSAVAGSQQIRFDVGRGWIAKRLACHMGPTLDTICERLEEYGILAGRENTAAGTYLRQANIQYPAGRCPWQASWHVAFKHDVEMVC